MSEWIDCPKCGMNHENQTACPAPALRSSEIEIPKDITEAAIAVSRWMTENGHARWELFDLCSRDHAAELGRANEKLRRIARMVDLAQASIDAKSDSEIAASATFHEALAIITGEIYEAERDAALADVARLRGELEIAHGIVRASKQSRTDMERNFRKADVRRIEAERARDKWKDIAGQLASALGNDGIECNNFLTRIVRAAALADYEAMKQDQP